MSIPLLTASLLLTPFLALFARGDAPDRLPMRPFALHPQNPHYFIFRGQPTILITSAEHYGAVLNLDFDYIKYLDELHTCGLNHTRLWTGTYRELAASFDIQDNTLAPQPNRYICPWACSSIPGYSEGGNKFDLAHWDDAFFARLKDFMSQASARGIVVEVNLFCTEYKEELWAASPLNARNNIQGVGRCGPNEVYALAHPDITAAQEAVTRKIVQELAPFDNLYYEVCNEPYFGGVTQAWQNHIADIVIDAEKNMPHQHLISMNIANGSAKIQDPHPGVSIFNFHYCTPPTVVAENAALNKPIGENETGFRGNEDTTYRSEAWDFLLAGGAIYNNLDYSFTAQHPDGTAQVSAPGGGSRALRKQLQFLKNLLYSCDFLQMAAHDELITAGVDDQHTVHCLAQPGVHYVIYIKAAVLGNPGVGDWHDRPPIDIKEPTRSNPRLTLPAGVYQVQWLNPTTCEAESTEKLTHAGGPIAFQSPSYKMDIALSIKRTN